jgi:hypothetical protein
MNRRASKRDKEREVVYRQKEESLLIGNSSDYTFPVFVETKSLLLVPRPKWHNRTSQ